MKWRLMGDKNKGNVVKIIKGLVDLKGLGFVLSLVALEDSDQMRM